jgi:uncharacterized protein (TIGR03083 family)
MPPISPERFYAEIETRTARLADLVSDTDLALPVPACPGWTLSQLATHVGRAHRWAAEIVGTRSPEFIAFRAVPDGRFPDDPALHAAWLKAGAQRVTGAVREAGSDPVWAFGGIAPASFWARRMAHETMMHTVDAELATGHAVTIAPDLAADAIDEWLTFLSGPVFGRDDQRAQALPQGRALQVRAAGDGLDGSAEWLVSHVAADVTVQPGHGTADVTLAGPAARVLLVLVRRLPPSDPSVEVLGDASVLEQWLAQTPF